MPTVLLNDGLIKGTNTPDSYVEVSIHPVTKQRGRWAVRTSRPIEVWDRKEHRMKWVRQAVVEPLPELKDDPAVVVVSAGMMSASDFKEVSEELAESREKRRKNYPTYAPSADAIKEACREIRISGEDEWTVGNQTFRRPTQNLLIPRDAAWAKAMAEESRREW